MAEARWFVYLIECATGRIYTGITPTLARRLSAHKRGRGALFTRINPPERLLAAKAFASRRDAQQLEGQIKRLSAAHKRYLAAEWSQKHPIDQCAQEAITLE